MKTITKLLCILFFISFGVSAQDITGSWNGLLKVQGIQLRVIFNVSKKDNGYTSTMDSPDQGASGIPVTQTSFKDSKIKFVVANAGIEYTGEFQESKFVGVFKQGGQEFDMILSKKEVKKETVKRSQEPLAPYSYHVEDVMFKNPKANISLAGTLTLPKKEGVFPVVILISGSGQQDRNSELLGHKPFLVIADYLTKNGIAVLRYDDRGVGQSKGVFETATSADFATDVESAIAYLKTRKEIDKSNIGLIGHSEGGLVASMIASNSTDVDFIIMLAAPGLQGDQLLLLQQETIAKVKGVSQEDIKKSKDQNQRLFKLVLEHDNNPTLKSDLTKLINEVLKNESVTIPKGMTKEQFVDLQVHQIASPWMQYFLKFNPVKSLKKVACPVLVLNGEKDLQVPPKENVSAINEALTKGGNKKVTVRIFEGLNHLFQDSKTGLPSEYGALDQSFSPKALEVISTWITSQVK